MTFQDFTHLPLKRNVHSLIFQHCTLLTTTCSTKTMCRLKRNLPNSESSVRQEFFVQLCQKKSNDFSHWLLSFAPWTFPYICCRLISWSTFSFDTDKMGWKREAFLQSRVKKRFQISVTWHFYFLTFAAQGVTVKHDSSSCPITHPTKGLIFSFSTLEVKCGA